MEVILKKDVTTLGYRLDVVDVKPGYARNFLIPKGIAVIANAPNRKILAEDMRQAQNKLAQLKADAEAMAEKMAGVNLKVGAKVGESGKIFGAVTTIQIADALSKEGFEVDRKKISIELRRPLVLPS